MGGMTSPPSPSALRAQLAAFTGSAYWYADPSLPRLRFTDGVKYFIDQTQAVEVLVHANCAVPLLSKEPFLSLIFERQEKSCSVLVQDGNYGELLRLETPLPGLPEGQWEFWLENAVLYLPSEH